MTSASAGGGGTDGRAGVVVSGPGAWYHAPPRAATASFASGAGCPRRVARVQPTASATPSSRPTASPISPTGVVLRVVVGDRLAGWEADRPRGGVGVDLGAGAGAAGRRAAGRRRSVASVSASTRPV